MNKGTPLSLKELCDRNPQPIDVLDFIKQKMGVILMERDDDMTKAIFSDLVELLKSEPRNTRQSEVDQIIAEMFDKKAA